MKTVVAGSEQEKAVVTGTHFSLMAAWKNTESCFLSKCALLCSLPLSSD